MCATSFASAGMIGPHYDSGFAKIFCGGSWEADGEGAVRVTQHSRNTPSVQGPDVGFRCAREGLRVEGDVERSRNLY